MVDVPPEVYKLVCLVVGVHLAHCLYAEYGGGLWHPLRVSDMVRPNAAHTTTVSITNSLYVKTTTKTHAIDFLLYSLANRRSES